MMKNFNTEIVKSKQDKENNTLVLPSLKLLKVSDREKYYKCS